MNADPPLWPRAETAPRTQPGDIAAEGYFVVLNTASGKKAGTLSVEELEERIAALPGPTTVRRAKSGRDLARLVKEATQSDAGTIVAAGGDGTICAVATALSGSGRRMGVVPMGTFNFFARGLGIPEDVEGAVRVLSEGRPVPVTVGEINGKIFLNNASLGAYPVILDQREGVYRRWGRSRLAAYWSVLRALVTVHRPLWMKITVDGKALRRRSPMAFVAMSGYQLEQYELDGADAVRDGRFALYVAPDTGRFGMILQAVKLAWRRLRPGRDVELFTGREIVIETSRKRRLVARDGEKEEMRSPFTFKALQGALTVLAPQDTPMDASRPADTRDKTENRPTT